MKLEIYQTGKLPPLTVVECDAWEVKDDMPRLILYKSRKIVAIFFVNNIAGFKEIESEAK